MRSPTVTPIRQCGWVQRPELPPLEGVCRTDLELLSAVALGPVPLDDVLPHVQQEDVPFVEAVPRHVHLVQSTLRP